jgi:oligopeptide/dipeptide ABC transporter ATP-binding protein
MSEAADLILDVKDLRVWFFTKRGHLKAVDGVSFDVRKGEVVGIIGESGSGKTVTSLSLLQLVPYPGRVVDGSIHFHDIDLLKLDESEIQDIRGNKISMIFQDPMTSLNPSMTVGRQVAESYVLHKKFTWKRAIDSAISILGEVKIPSPENRINEYPHQFSGGMRQRGMIAMALACEPELLIADEPTTALDVTIQAQILELIRETRRKRDMSIIYITHALGVVAEICDRVNVMYAGNIVESAEVDVLLKEPLHPYTQGLLDCVPRVGHFSKLKPLLGTPPVLTVEEERGCPFKDRCYAVMPKCEDENPPQIAVGPDRRVSCWLVEP